MNPTDDKSTLVQVMAWCHQATSHYLSQCWPRSLSPYGATRPQWVNSLAPGRCVCDFKSVIFEHIIDYIHKNLWICSEVNATGPKWWWVNIGSGNIGPDLFCHMASLVHNELSMILDGVMTEAHFTKKRAGFQSELAFTFATWLAALGSSLLTHWGWNKWPPFSRRHFQMHFLE